MGDARQHCRATSFSPRGQPADRPVGLGTLTVVELWIFLYNTRDTFVHSASVLH